MPNLFGFVNNGEDYGRLKIRGKRIRENLRTSPRALARSPTPERGSERKFFWNKDVFSKPK